MSNFNKLDILVISSPRSTTLPAQGWATKILKKGLILVSRISDTDFSCFVNVDINRFYNNSEICLFYSCCFDTSICCLPDTSFSWFLYTGVSTILATFLGVGRKVQRKVVLYSSQECIVYMYGEMSELR